MSKKTASLDTDSTTSPSPGGFAIFRYLAPGIRGQRHHVITATSCLFLGVFLRLIEPWPLQIVLDSIIGNVSNNLGDTDAIQRISKTFGIDKTIVLLVICAASLVLIAMVRASIDYYRTVTFSLMGNHVISELRSRLFRHIQTLSLDFHQRSRGGDMTVRLTSDINMLKDVTVTAALPLLSSGLLLIGMISVMLWLNWRLGLLVVAVFPLFAFVTYRSSRKIHRSAQNQRRREGAMAAAAAESIASVKSLQAHGTDVAFSGAFSKENSKSHKEGAKTSRLTAGLERSVDVQIAIVTALILFQGTRFVLDGSLTAGELVVYLAYLKRGFKPLQDFAKYTGRLSKAMAAGERIVEILDEKPEIEDSPGATLAPPLRGDIEFRGIHFVYKGGSGEPVFRGFNISIKAGEHVAIVGPSGVGKSTLLSLLLRLRDPNEGSIFIDGHDLRQWTLNSLRDRVATILQENGIFAASVRDNIALAVPDATMDQVVEAAKAAAADEFIRQFPDGYDTMLGERGVNLSHGQSQRLAIARAAIRNSSILLLDEPTSSLDAESRSRVMSALSRITRGRTTLMVTHDLDLAMNADRILFLGRDGVYQFGSHHDLMHCCLPYRELIESQFDHTIKEPISHAIG